MYSLSYSEAVAMMKKGCKVKHKYFTSGEFFHIPANNGGHMVDETGCYMDDWYRGESWQENGWMVIEEECNKNKLIVSALDFSSAEDRVLDYFNISIKEMPKGVDLYGKSYEVLVDKSVSLGYTQNKGKSLHKRGNR